MIDYNKKYKFVLNGRECTVKELWTGDFYGKRYEISYKQMIESPDEIYGIFFEARNLVRQFGERSSEPISCTFSELEVIER